MIDVTPAIFTDNLLKLKSQIAALRVHVPWIQLDLSDGTMVPAKTVFALDALAKIVTSNAPLSFEAHLMVDNPVKYLKPLADAGFKRIIAQVEASDPHHFLEEAQLESVDVGLALDGTSELELIEPFLDAVDLVVIMTIEAGDPNGPFLPDSVERIKSLRNSYPHITIAAEGSIDRSSATILVEAGVNRLIIATETLMKEPELLRKAR